MHVEISPERFDAFVLLRLACGTAKSPPTRSTVAKAFQGIVGDGAGADLDASIARLDAAGMITAKPLRITEAGRRRAAQAVGLPAIPPGSRWDQFRKRYLVAAALEVDAAVAKREDRVAKAEHAVGEVLRRSLGAAARSFPSRIQVADALIWRALGVETDKPASAGALRDHVIEQLVGPSRASFASKVDVAAARALDAPHRRSANSLQDELVQRWLEKRPVPFVAAGESTRAGGRETHEARPTEGSPRGADQVPRGDGQAEPPSDSLPAFARSALAAAARVGAGGRFGENKVFISEAWQASDKDRTLEQFKARLAEANREGLLRLARADLVGLMPEELVRASETRYLNASFHFIDTTPRGSR
jgi:hypothetical protein